MMLMFMQLKVDPFDLPEEELKKFANGHPALEYLLYEYDSGFFHWPSGKVNEHSSYTGNFELGEKGMLAAMGYRVGKTKGKSERERRKILQNLFQLDATRLPRIDNPDSMNKWRAERARDRRMKRFFSGQALWAVLIKRLKN